MDKRIVQGTQLRPVLSAKPFSHDLHAGLDVEVDITLHSTGEHIKNKLQIKDGQRYTAEELFDTANRLGKVTFHYVVRCFLIGFGEVSFDLDG